MGVSFKGGGKPPSVIHLGRFFYSYRISNPIAPHYQLANDLFVFSLFRTHVRIGSSDLGDTSFLNTHEVIFHETHPNYVKGVGYYDIAVLTTIDVQFSDFIRPVCLPNQVNGDIDQTYEGKAVELIGWGSSDALGQNSKNLKRVSIEIVPFRYNTVVSNMNCSVERTTLSLR